MVLGILFYIMMVIVSFVCFIKHEQKTDGLHNNGVVVFCYFVLSFFCFVFVPVFILIFILKYPVKLITGGK